MKRSTLCLVALSGLLGFTIAGCGSKQQTNTSSPASTTAGVAVDTATSGSVTGTVRLDGMPLKMKTINMAAEPACSKQHATPVTSQEVIAGKEGALDNVVVYLQGDFSKYKFDMPTGPATITQKGCMYDPHVVAMQTDQQFQVVNADPVTHNIHPLPKDNREWNESQPPGAAPIDRNFSRPEIGIAVKCNIHPWMKAYIAVFDNPYFAVTRPDGSFDLKNVPPGTYILTAWHELYGKSQQSVTIGPKESKTIQIVFQNTPAAHS
jgi:hypothetical protein